jgi:hypothetical protein
MVAVKWPKAPPSGGQYTHTIRKGSMALEWETTFAASRP